MQSYSNGATSGREQALNEQIRMYEDRDSRNQKEIERLMLQRDEANG